MLNLNQQPDFFNKVLIFTELENENEPVIIPVFSFLHLYCSFCQSE